MFDGIWIARSCSTAQEVSEAIEELWQKTENPGSGGQLLALPDEESAVTLSNAVGARLQQFANALACELRFKTFEVFLSPIHDDRQWRQASPYLIGGSYRAGDTYSTDPRKYGRSTKGTVSQDQPIYPLSHSYVSQLKDLMVFGERYADVVERIEGYKTRALPSDIDGYIGYKILGTILAYLARFTDQKRGAGPKLWECCATACGLKLPRADIRTALAFLIAAENGRLLVEDGQNLNRTAEIAKRLIDESSDGPLRIAGVTDARKVQSAVDDAITLWQEISQRGDEVGNFVRSKTDNLPFEVLQFLFEARPHTYVPWLQSATLSVEEDRPIRHSDLDRRISNAAAKRNKQVDVLAKYAYERAARGAILGNENRLKSMFLAPFTGRPSSTWAVHGFVRFMNRFIDQQLYDYDAQTDVLDRDEQYLASAVANVLSRELSDPVFLGLAEPPPPPTKSSRSEPDRDSSHSEFGRDP